MRTNFIFALVSFASCAIAADFPADQRDRAVQATVQVTSQPEKLTGSGTVVHRQGPHAYVLTASHVVGPKVVEVRTPAGKTLKAEVVGRSDRADLSVLRIANDESLGSAIRIGDRGAKASACISVGWPSGDKPAPIDERILERLRVRRPDATYSTDCWVMEKKPVPGRSGGALVNRDGRLIGVASGHDAERGYFVHVDEVHAFLRANALSWIADDDR